MQLTFSGCSEFCGLNFFPWFLNSLLQVVYTIFESYLLQNDKFKIEDHSSINAISINKLIESLNDNTDIHNWLAVMLQ